MTYKIHAGNNLDILPTLPDNSVDSIVTDPPYGLSNMTPEKINETLAKWLSGERDFIPEGAGFMGKAWDAFVPPPAIWDECLRVLKPGGHLLAFFGSRTMDIGSLSIRLAGFEIRDTISWIYATGFPKSLDISKAIDKAAGAEREVLGRNPNSRENATKDNTLYESGTVGKTDYLTTASTPEAQQWQGWGTALKPAFEPVIVARKPIEGTVANNVLTYGTGGLNIDGSRIGTDGGTAGAGAGAGARVFGDGLNGPRGLPQEGLGRWPANVVLDEYTAGLLDEQSGQSKSQGGRIGKKETSNIDFGLSGNFAKGDPGYGDTGGASRFFYVAKASKRDRNEGLDELESTRVWDTNRKPENVGSNTPQNRSTQERQNFHPTVKPTDLMRYLVKLVTPPNGTVLDPFTGSGSTGKAAILEGFDFIGIEMTEEYLPIIEGRLKNAEAKVAERIKEAANQEQEKLF